ncbi:uncharacterized protein LOC106646256, partial [Copidosoma floridanum]|uniref:uncharacterized protein LOC106646256 n=1 Tax=Copidosoma floridanum TaxID=29053 RepID=UPI0006C9787F
TNAYWAATKQFPYYVTVRPKNTEKYSVQSLCGGALIKKNYAIISNSCKLDKNDSYVAFDFFDTYTKGEGSKLVAINKIVRPTQQIENNVALLQLKEEMELNDYVNVVSLPTANANVEMKKDSLFITWNSYVYFIKWYYAIYYNKAQILNEGSCEEILQTKMSTSTFCIRGFLELDSPPNPPGAILIQTYDYRPVLVGIAGSDGRIFTKVSSHVDWILREMEAMENQRNNTSFGPSVKIDTGQQ